MKNNIAFVNYAKKALRENWGYCLGTFGQTLTPALLKQKTSQGNGVGTYNTRHRAYHNKFMNKKVSDCYGIVKGFLWTDSTGKIRYNSSQDRNANTAYKEAKEKGPISTIPEIPGLILWMKGHAGVYIGNGEFIECAGAPKGMQKGKIEGARVVSGNQFTHWFKDTHITYNEMPLEDEYKQAIKTMVQAGIIKSPAVWNKNLDNNVRSLIIKTANFILKNKISK